MRITRSRFVFIYFDCAYTIFQMSCKPSCYYILLYTKCVKNLTIVVILSTLQIVKKHLRESLWEFFLLLLFGPEVGKHCFRLSAPATLKQNTSLISLVNKTCSTLCDYFNTKHANLVTCLHGDLSAKRKVKIATLNNQYAVFRVVNVNLHLDKFVSESVENNVLKPKESDNKLTSKRRSQIDRVPSDTSSGINLNFQWNQ